MEKARLDGETVEARVLKFRESATTDLKRSTIVFKRKNKRDGVPYFVDFPKHSVVEGWRFDSMSLLHPRDR